MEIIEALERDEKLRKRLTKLIVSEIVLDPEIKLLLVEKSLETIATKNDIKDLRNEIKDVEEGLRKEIKDVENRLRNEIKEVESRLRKEIKDVENKLRSEIKDAEERLKSYVDTRFDALNKRIDDMNKRIDDLFKIVSATLIAIVVGIVSLFASKLFI